MHKSLSEPEARRELLEASEDYSATIISKDDDISLARSVRATIDTTAWLDLKDRSLPRAITRSSVRYFAPSRDRITTCVGTMEGDELCGMLLGNNSDTIYIRLLDSLRRSIATLNISTIKVRTPKVFQGSVIGAISGFAAGLIWSASTPRPKSSDAVSFLASTFLDDLGRMIVIGCSLFAGAMVGGIIGTGITTVYYPPGSRIP